MAQNEWAVVSQTPIARTAGTGWEVVEQKPIQEKQSAFRQIADVPLGIAKGAVQGVRMIADAFGAGTSTSNTIKSAETYLADLMSAQAKNDQQEISRIMKDAEDKGVLDQVKAGLKAFAIAPVDTLSSALGTAAPVIVGALGAKVLGAGALVSTGVSALTGAGMGAGTIKGSIYEETKRTLKDAGASEEEAERRAQLAQQYNGKNLDQILLGTVLGGAAAVGPLEKGGAAILARRILGKTGVEATESVAEQTAKGALRRRAEAGLLEAVPEAVQAGQEQVAQNIALQREGMDVPTFRGAVSAATMEALAGAGLGATVGGGKPPPAPAAAPAAPPVEAPVAPALAAPEKVRQRVEEVTGISRAAPTSAEESVLGRLYKLDDAEAEAAREELTRQRLQRQQEQIDVEAERVAELNRKQGMPSPDRPKLEIEERPSIAEAPPALTPREELVAKQAEVDKRRLEAGLPTGAASETPGVQPEPTAPEETKPVPKIVDERPLTERAAQNRLLVMRNMLQNQGGDPQSLTIVPHPTVEGKFAIQSLDVPTKFTPDLPKTAITRPETPTIIDPVNAYVEIQRRTNTPAARRFVQEYEAGQITREDVERAIEQEQKAGQPQPLTYTATGAPGIVAPEVSKPRGEREVPKLGETPPKVEAEPPVDEPPGEEPPTPKATLPQTLEEFETRMPVVFDKAEVREANNQGNFAQLAKALQLSPNPAIRRIGQLGSGVASKITLRKPGRLGPGVAGVYRYADDSIQMIPTYAGDEHVNAHETLHALISKAQRFPTDRQKPVVQQIEKLFEHVKKELKKKGITAKEAYGLTNPREFTAEAMSNPKFQYELMQIPYPGKKSAWTQFVRLVADLLGIQNTNALTEVMNLVDRLAMQKQPRKTVTDKGLTDEMTERPPELDTTGLAKVIKGRDPQLQAAAQQLKEGKITREQYEQYVNYYTPIEAVEADKLRPPSTEEAMRGAVASNKANLVNQPIADGAKVGLRLDIPSTRAGVPTVSVHEGASGKASQGKAKSYTSTAHITNATFETRSQKAGLEIAVGAGKEPLQTVEGTWVNEDPQSVFEKVKGFLRSPDWVQVGFDPTRHGYFYDRKTGDPVASASEVYQIGTLLVAKDVKYAPKTDFLYSVEPTIKSDRVPSYKRGVENLRKRWEKGDLTSDEFAARVDILAKQVEMAELAKEKAGRERGADFLRQRLLEAKRRGELSPEAVDFAEWFILQNPALVDDLGISIRTPKEDGVGGMYSSYGRVMYLMKERGSDQTVVHEILHHLERMMPKEVQSAIRKTWIKSLMEAQKNAKTDAEKQFFKNLTDFHFGFGSRSLLKSAIDAIKEGDVSKGLYQYTSPSEFWAENGSEIMKGRFDVKGSVLGRLKQWLSELKEKARDLFGLENKAAIIRALDSLSKGDGKFVTSTLLDKTTEPKLSVTEKVTAAAQKALQKQPVPEKGLSHVSKDLVNLTQPIFFPQNKTIIDRIEGMKDRFWQRLAQKTADQFRTIKEYSPTGYMQARLSKSIDGSLEGLLFHGQVFDDGGALNIKKNTKGMMDILKPIGNELDSYLMWVALNRESTLPDPKRSKIPNMDKLVARRAEFAAGELNGKPRVEVYQDVLRQMNQLNKSVLDIALAKGLIDQTGYDKFSNDIYYIPFYKKMEEDGTIEGAQTASGLTSQYFSKELKGGEAPFGDLMENIVRNWSHILSASMKNAAAKTTIDDAMKLQAAEPNLKAGLEMRDGVVYSTKSDKPIEAKFDEDGKQIYAEGELRPDLTTSGTGMAKIMVNGQPMYFKVTDELLMDSISSIGYMGPKSKFLDVARNFKNMLQYGVTASPIFKVNNLIRDSISALAVSDLKKSPVYNVMTGISLSKKDSPTYISALAGGGIFNFGSAYEGDQAKLIKRLIDQGVDGDTILDSKEKITKALKKTWDAYQHLGDRSEAANRLALYQQMRDKGMSHLQASFMARDLLDFSMQGSWPAFRLITQVVPFMNARIQGLYKLGRDGINPTVRVLYNATTGKEIDANDKIRAAQFSVVTAAVMAASALLYLSFKDDEDFKKRDAWDRDNFWWFKIPSLDIAFRVPKPFEVGAFGTLVERSLEQIYDQGSEGKTFADSLKRTLWDTFALNPTPQMFKPLFDLYANKDSFSGAPIESAGLERLSKQERMTEQTSPLAIALSKVWSTVMPAKVESSPVQVDYAIKGYFGWLGAMASMASTYAVMPFKEGEYPDARWLDRASLGLVRDLPAPQSAYVTAFYENAKEISQAYADMRHYREIGDAEKVQEILEKSGDKIALAKFYDKTSKNIANVRKQIQFITNDKTLDGATKKEEIERMKLIMSDLAKQAEEVRKSMKP